jgi:hypothetical protein
MIYLPWISLNQLDLKVVPPRNMAVCDFELEHERKWSQYFVSALIVHIALQHTNQGQTFNVDKVSNHVNEMQSASSD